MSIKLIKANKQNYSGESFVLKYVNEHMAIARDRNGHNFYITYFGGDKGMIQPDMIVNVLHDAKAGMYTARVNDYERIDSNPFIAIAQVVYGIT